MSTPAVRTIIISLDWLSQDQQSAIMVERELKRGSIANADSLLKGDHVMGLNLDALARDPRKHRACAADLP